MIEASQFMVETTSNMGIMQRGTIRISGRIICLKAANGRLENSGKLLAGDNTKASKIDILAQNIYLKDNSQLIATGGNIHLESSKITEVQGIIDASASNEGDLRQFFKTCGMPNTTGKNKQQCHCKK